MTIEADPAHGNVDSLYTYDKYDRLTNVSMTRGSVTQARAFACWVLTKELTRTTNPENGTVQYECDAQQRLLRKTNAKGQKVQYTYDSYSRVVEVHRYRAPGTVADPCQKATFTYDINGVERYFAQNTGGRVAIAEWSGTGCPGGTKFQEMYSYTAAAAFLPHPGDFESNVVGFASCPVLLASHLSGLRHKAAAVRRPLWWFWVLTCALERHKPLSARWESGNLAPSARFPRECGSR